MATSETHRPLQKGRSRSVRSGTAEQRARFITGIAGVVVFLLAWVEHPTLPNGASGQVARSYLENHMGSAALSVLAQCVALIALVVFVMGMHWLMRRVETRGTLFSDLTVLSGGLVAVWFWLQASLDALPLVLADDAGKLTAYSDPALVFLEPLTRLGETLGDLGTIPRGFLMLAISLLALRTRFVPRWIGFVGVVIGGVSLLATPAAWAVPIFGAAVLVGLFGFYLWLLLLSVALGVAALRRPSARDA
jgi:hypothetical protein